MGWVAPRKSELALIDGLPFYLPIYDDQIPYPLKTLGGAFTGASH